MSKRGRFDMLSEEELYMLSRQAIEALYEIEEFLNKLVDERRRRSKERKLICRI